MKNIFRWSSVLVLVVILMFLMLFQPISLSASTIQTVPAIITPTITNFDSSNSLPAGIIYSVPITLTNTQSIATPAPFQQMITLDYLAYTSYEASNLQNVEFFDSHGAVIPSWLESENYDGLHNALYWLSLANGIPANSSITVYIGFASLTTNLFNGKTIGEAPWLSSQYAQYDNGQSLFLAYYNMKTNPVTSSLSGLNYYSIANDMGPTGVSQPLLTWTGVSPGNELASIRTIQFPASFSITAWIDTDFSSYEIGLGSTTSTALFNGYMVDPGAYGNKQLALWKTAGNNRVNNGGISALPGTPYTMGSAAWYTLQYNYTNGGKISGYVEPYQNTLDVPETCTGIVTTDSSYNSFDSILLAPYSDNSLCITSWALIAARSYPPNGVMPSESVQTTSPSGTTTTPTSSSSNQVASDIPGTTLAFGASLSSVVNKATEPRDVYALSLSAGQQVQIQVAGYPGQLNFVLAAPGSTSFGGNSYMQLFNSSSQSTVNPWSYTFMPSASGTYYFAVNAWENISQPYTIKVVVNGGISPSTPALQRTPPTVTLYPVSVSGQSITINGVTQPTTPGATITSINWNWGDGSTSNGLFPQTHTYNQKGTYTINVTVIDSNGLSASTSETTNVIGITNPTTSRMMPSASSTSSLPRWAFDGASAKYQVKFGYQGGSIGGISIPSVSTTLDVSYTVANVDVKSQSFSFATNYTGYLAPLSSANSPGSFNNPSPFPAVSLANLTLLNQGSIPKDIAGSSVKPNVMVSITAGKFKTDELTTSDGNVWVETNSGLIVKQTGALITLPGATMELQSTNIVKNSQIIHINYYFNCGCCCCGNHGWISHFTRGSQKESEQKQYYGSKASNGDCPQKCINI